MLKDTLSIITINFNGFKDTCALLDTIPKEEGFEIIVVDNASYKDEASAIEQRYPYVHVVRSQQNLGFAGGNNLGIQASHGKYLLFINNDTEIPGVHWKDVYKLIARLESDEHTGMVCPKIRFFWDNHPIQFAGYTPLSNISLRNRSIGFGEADNGQYDTPHPTPYAHGASMLLKHEVIEKAGLMPECYFLYYEELDWSLLIRRAGYDIWYDPSLTVYHKESQTTGQGSPLRTYYITRNRLLFARRNIATQIRYITYLYLILVVGTRDILKHTLSGHATHVKAVVRGIFDFIRKRQGK